MRLAVVATALFAVLPALASVNAGADSQAIAARHEHGAVGHGTDLERRHAHRRRHKQQCNTKSKHHGSDSADSTDASDSSSTDATSASAGSESAAASPTESASDASSASASASASSGVNAGGRELYKQNSDSESASDSPSSESASGSATATDGASSAASASSTDAAAPSGTASSTDSSPSSTSSTASGGSLPNPGASGGLASMYSIGGSAVFCGQEYHDDSPEIVAISQGWWNRTFGSPESHEPCGKTITIKWGDTVKTATVQDQCVGCEDNKIDLPEGFWKTFTSNTKLGILGLTGPGQEENRPLTWTWN